MSTSRRIVIAIGATALAACAAQAPTGRPPALGVAAGPPEIARFDISIPPSGAGLPSGSGTARQGAAVYAAKCVARHGEKGADGAQALGGGAGGVQGDRRERQVPSRRGDVAARAARRLALALRLRGGLPAQRLQVAHLHA